jgi:RNA polymerase sigma-70 factor (ECF subfamily)
MTFENIYLEFDAKLRNFIFGRVSDRDVAEDILQDVYLKIHGNIDSVQDSEKLESWIYQITRHAIVDYYRRARNEEELPESLPALQEEEPDAVADLSSSVHEMLNAIPEKYRQALMLTEIQGLTQAEMADRLGLTLSGAKSRVQRAREKLKEAYLECCHFEFDRLGKVIHYESKCCHCVGNSENCN